MFKRLITLLRILITKPLSIPKVYRTSQERHEIEKYYKYIQNQKIIWHFCSPKSASTFLMRKFEMIAETNNSISIIKMFRSGKNRNNIIDLEYFYKNLKKNKINITTHAHTLPTDDIIKCFSNKHTIIIQTRNLIDTIVSLHDGMEHSQKKFWMPFAYKYWNDKKIDKYNDIIFNYVPFHINFLNGWLKLNTDNLNLNILFIKYKDIIDSKNDKKIFKSIFKNYNKININNDLIIEKSLHNNFNVGKIGRGINEVPKNLIDEINYRLITNDHFGYKLDKYLYDD